MRKVKVGILFGGCSEEHDISIKSAGEIARNIDREKYELYWIGISRDNCWRLYQHPLELKEEKGGQPVLLSSSSTVSGLLLLEAPGCYTNIPLDVIFPVLHGKMGEDGTIQGLLELSGIPYVGCDLESSIVSMDKSLAYLLVRRAGIASPAFWMVDANHPAPDWLPYPVFVKPARSGSSFGVSRVDSADMLHAAMIEAAKYDSRILIEEAIQGSEVGCAIMGNGQQLFVGELDQICLSHGFFKIHQEKNPEQGSANAQIVVPAALPEEVQQQIKETAKSIYRALGCRGLARIDMFYQADGRVVLNEVNTLPGFTSYSRFPRMMAAAGLSMSALIDCLIDLAIRGE